MAAVDRISGFSLSRIRRSALRVLGKIEWPTVLLIVAFHVSFAFVVVIGDGWPVLVTLGSLALLGVLYGSIQHETVHGHPTPWHRLNSAVAALPLGLIYPYWLYHESHLIHHEVDELTHPDLDPESKYLLAAQWANSGRFYRGLRAFAQTLFGRLLLGPLMAFVCVSKALGRRFFEKRDRLRIVVWVASLVVVPIVVQAAGLSAWKFIVGFVYFGMSGTLLRSFAEHRAVSVGERTAVVHSRWFWGLLFLNNNLHVTHHRHPGLAWYRIPAVHRSSDADEAAAVGAGLYAGYGALFRKYMFRPVDDVVFPLSAEASLERSTSLPLD